MPIISVTVSFPSAIMFSCALAAEIDSNNISNENIIILVLNFIYYTSILIFIPNSL